MPSMQYTNQEELALEKAPTQQRTYGAEKKGGNTALQTIVSQQQGSMESCPQAHDAVFGVVTEGGPNYRSVRLHHTEHTHFAFKD